MGRDIDELARINRKKKFQLRRKHSNSKHGCLQCKKRRIKCGQELPQCKHCSSYRAKNLRCSYMDLSYEDRKIIEEENKKINESEGYQKEAYELVKLPKALKVTAAFKLYHLKISSNNEQLLRQTFKFISINLKMPITDVAYTKYIVFVWNIWGNTAISDASKQRKANFYSLIAWASSYLSACVYNSVKDNVNSQLSARRSKTTMKPLQNIALLNNGYSLTSLTKALEKCDYRLLLDLMSSNTFFASSNFKEDGYKSRMYHVNGLVAIIYELYLQGNDSTIYLSGYNDYSNQDLSFLGAKKIDHPSHHINTSESTFAPGYSYFNNFTPKESILIKFFEWQIYLAVAAAFFPPYSHECLLEFYENILDFKIILEEIGDRTLLLYVNNLLQYYDFLFQDIIPLMCSESSGNFFQFNLRLYYKVLMNYLLITPPETFLAIVKGKHYSVVENILYRYYINTGKMLDQIFPQVRYLFVIGFLSAFTQYSDEIHVFDEFLFGGDCRLLPGSANRVDLDASTLRYHAIYNLRVFGFLRSRNLLLHHGLRINDPFDKQVKKNRLASRALKVLEIQIRSFNQAFIRANNLPHSAAMQAADVSFKGFTLQELISKNTVHNPTPVIETHKATPKELMSRADVPVDQNGNLIGHDYVMSTIETSIVIKHLVGKSLRDFYDDRSSLFNYFEEH